MAHSASGNTRRVTARSRVSSSPVGFPTPDQIRVSIQQLVAENDIERAHQLVGESLDVYPENEGVLAISGLVAVVRNDWARAVELLERLVAIQGERASEFTRMMLERARNCLGNAVPVERQPIAAPHVEQC